MNREEQYEKDRLVILPHTDLKGNKIISSVYLKRGFIDFTPNAVVITQWINSLHMVNYCVSTEESHIKNRTSKDIHNVGIWRPKLITNN